MGSTACKIEDARRASQIRRTSLALILLTIALGVAYAAVLWFLPRWWRMR